MTAREIQEALAAPFPANAIEWKPQVVSKDGSKAMAVAYVGARAVMDRLDEVLGIACWQDAYESMPNGTVVCTLSIRINGEWVSRQNVGVPSAQPSAGDQRKSAYSSALKRTAVEFGVGRYLYRLPRQWVDYDAQKKCFTGTPTLPDWALPRPKPNLPRNGEEFTRRLLAREAKLTAEGKCRPGDLLAYVLACGVRDGAAPSTAGWGETEFRRAVDYVRDFEAGYRLAATQGREEPQQESRPAPPAERPVRRADDPCTAGELDELSEAMSRKGVPYRDLQKQLGLSKRKFENLLYCHHQKILEILSEVPDRVAAAR